MDILACLEIAAAAAVKSLQSCLTLFDPVDGSPPGSPVQARTLEWVTISFSSAWKWKVKVKSLSHVRLLVTPRTAAHQAPPSMGFSRQEDWSGVPLPSPLEIESSVLKMLRYYTQLYTKQITTTKGPVDPALWFEKSDQKWGGWWVFCGSLEQGVRLFFLLLLHSCNIGHYVSFKIVSLHHSFSKWDKWITFSFLVWSHSSGIAWFDVSILVWFCKVL